MILHLAMAWLQPTNNKNLVQNIYEINTYEFNLFSLFYKNVEQLKWISSQTTTFQTFLKNELLVLTPGKL